MHIGAFEQLAAILVVSALAALLAVLLRQPILLGLLIAGIALGPGVLGLVRIDESITLLAEVGIALLLFLVGLKLDVRIVARLGPVALVVGLTQIVLTFLLGLGIAAAFGRTGIAAVYLGLALTFSSTVVVVKLLTDVRMIDRLHGRLAVGILVIQDIVVVLAMIALTATAGDGGAIAIGEFIGVLLRGVVFVLASLVLGRFVATPTMHLLGRQAELLDRGEHVVGVDFDPRAVAEGRLGIPILYGDADDPSLGEHLPLEGSRWVVSTLRSLEANLTLVRSLRLNGYPGAIAVASEDPADCERLRAAGADVTIQPLHVAAAPLVARLDADDARRAAHDDVARDAAFAEFIVERADESDHSR